jgi:Uma2 family endonuclease
MTLSPQTRPFTRADLVAVPDDGHRYEIVDGALLVTPAPSRRHQLVSGNLHVLLATRAPGDLRVVAAPTDLALKRSRYGAAGIPSYWTVDPDNPEVVACDLRDGEYAEVGRATGSTMLSVTQPFSGRDRAGAAAGLTTANASPEGPQRPAAAHARTPPW